MQKNPEEISGEIVKLVRDTVGPVAALRKVLFVRALPKTRSGKIPRSSLSDLVNGKPFKVGRLEVTHAAERKRLTRMSPQITPTIEDPDVFAEIEREVEKVLRPQGG